MILERININQDQLNEIETRIMVNRHIERYALVRQFCHGSVLDAGCGCGYGAWMIAQNPDVNKVTGIDYDIASIDLAKLNFGTDTVYFIHDSIESFPLFWHLPHIFDVIVCLEVIEHLENPAELLNLCQRCQAQEIILSFPHKKTTHYNRFHKHDITALQVRKIFRESFDFEKELKLYDQTIIHMQRK